jgi:hypothetical protein
MTHGATATPESDTQGTPNAQARPVEPVKEGGVNDAIAEITQGRMFTGHPAMSAGEEGEGNNGPDTGEEGTPKKEDAAPPERQEGEPEKKEEPAKEEAPAFTPKHKSWEETEKARKEAERLAHTKAEKAAELERENQRIKDEADEVKRELESLKTKPKPQEPPKTDDVVERYAQALAKTAELNTFDPDYNKKVAKIMVEAGFAGQAAPDPGVLQQLVAEQVEAKVKEAVKAVKVDTDKADDESRMVRRVTQLAEDEGLDMTENSPDYKAFWMVTKDAPRNVPFEEQVKWAADEVKALKGAFRQGYQQEVKTGEEHQVRNAPMERGGTPPPAQPKKEEPFSINNILASSARKI